jgi:hypothetical protein
MRNILLNSSLCKYSMVRKAAAGLGWQEAEEGQENWQMFWTDLSVSHPRVKALTGLQRINHFPEMTRICHKAESATVLKSLHRYFATEFHFFPMSWALPKETTALHEHMSAARSPAFILKPNRGCQGADISLVENAEQLDAVRQQLGGTAPCVVQEYVDKPLLLGGYKFDLRVYVLVTSCAAHPHLRRHPHLRHQSASPSPSPQPRPQPQPARHPQVLPVARLHLSRRHRAAVHGQVRVAAGAAADGAHEQAAYSAGTGTGQEQAAERRWWRQ